MLHVGIITLFPEMFECLRLGVTGRAIQKGLINVSQWNPREWGHRRYRQVDDKPYGGGPGMVMMYEPLKAALTQAYEEMPTSCKTVCLSPQGKTIKQETLNDIVTENQALLFIAGRYEGVDERIITTFVDEEWSLGDFVISGGELAAMVFIDAIARLLPGCLGDDESAEQDSFMNGLLDYPHYTRPAIVDDMKVPEVLLTGNHREIERWRRKQALGKTWLKRPDLLEKLNLSHADKQLLAEFQHEVTTK